MMHVLMGNHRKAFISHITMLLLTESTLFFLNLTSSINTSTKLALGGRVTNWISGVKPGNPEPLSCPSIDSTSTRAPPSSIFSEGNASSAPTSAAELPTKIPAALPQIPDGVADDTLTGAFADDIDDSLEREDALLGSKKNKGKSKVLLAVIHCQHPNLLIPSFTGCHAIRRGL